MQLVVDIGTYQIKAGLFEGDKLLHTMMTERQDQLLSSLKDQKIQAALIASKDDAKGRDLMSLLTTGGFSCRLLNAADFKRLATSETESLLTPDRIANIFGALYHFPSNDCVIIDLGATVQFDYVSKQGVYLGGAIFPSFEGICGTAPVPMEKTRPLQSQSGSYFGLLGAIERIVAELRLSSETPSSVITLATGGPTNFPALQKELQDFIDHVDPHLTLIGLNQVLKEEKP